MATFRKRGAKWEYRISYKDPFTQKYKIKSKSGFITKKEAQLAATCEEKKIAEGFEETDLTLESFLYEWLSEYKKGTIRKNTFTIHERNIKNHIIPYFKKILLSKVKPIMYQKFLNMLSEQGYSKRTIEIIHGTAYSAFEKAKILGKIEKNPCTGVTIKGTVKKKEIKFLESEKIPEFYREAYRDGYIYWIFFKVLIETGLRKGEAAALQLPDLDLKNLTLDVNKTLDFQAKTNDDIFGATKTYKSERKVTISQSLANDLQFHLKYLNQNKLAFQEKYHHNLNLLLCRNDGNFMPKSSLFNAFSRILKQIDYPPMPIHSLRHTHAVLQMEAGADMKYIQTRLGHGSMQITSDVYPHISKNIEIERSNKFEQHMKNILK